MGRGLRPADQEGSSTLKPEGWPGASESAAALAGRVQGRVVRPALWLVDHPVRDGPGSAGLICPRMSLWPGSKEPHQRQEPVLQVLLPFQGSKGGLSATMGVSCRPLLRSKKRGRRPWNQA